MDLRACALESMTTVLGLSVVVALLSLCGVRGATVCDQPGVLLLETIQELQQYSSRRVNGSTPVQLCVSLRPGSVEYVDYITSPVTASSVEVLGNSSVVRCGYSSIPDSNYSTFPLMFGDGVKSISIVGVTFEYCQRPIQFREVERVYILRCTFRNFSPGGAVEIYNSADVTVELCSFTNNTSYGIGTLRNSGNAGAIAVGNDRDLDSDSPYVVEILNSNFYSNRALAYPLYRYNILYVLFSRLYNQRGGAVACYATLSTVVSIVGCTMEDNTAMTAGGAAYIFFEGVRNSSVAIHGCTFARNAAPYGGGVIVTIGTRNSAGRPSKMYMQDSTFISNRGGLNGGGFMSLQLDPENNLNVLEIVNCTFMNNFCEVGAAIYMDSRFIVRNTVRENRISLESCVFADNEGERGIVYFTGFAATFRGANQFVRNMGTSIRVVDALVLFGGENLFKFNAPLHNGPSGVIHLSSSGQMMLLENVTLEFYNNTGSAGACIVVDNVATATVFPRQLYNPRCFLQYQDPVEPSSNWSVSVIFENNSALVGPVVYASHLDGCLWYDLNNGTAYFSKDYTRFWGFMDIRNNYIIHNVDEDLMSTAIQQNYVQTDIHSIDLIDSTTRGAPGDTLELRAIALDEFDHETTAFLELSVNQEHEGNVSSFLPTVVQTVVGEPIDFRYLSNNVTGNTSVFVRAVFTNNQNVEELTKEFTLVHTECLPGYFLQNQRCICEETEEIVFCDPTRKGILLFDGLWGAPPNWSRTLVTHICPAGFCNCSNPREEIANDTIVGCFLEYDHPYGICHELREGILCGACRNGSGVGMLNNTCRVYDDVPQYYWLVPLYLLIVIPLLVGMVRLAVRIPTAMKSFVFYVQVSPIATEYFAARFNLHIEVMKSFGSILALYVPYDFPFHQGMTALESYGLRYFTPLLALIVVPIALAVRYHSKFLNGLWTVVYLLYVMAVETSVSLLYCADLGEMPSIRVWFFDGSMRCFEGAHIFLMIVAVIAMLLLGSVIVAVGVIAYYPSLKAMFPRLHRSSKLEEFSAVLTNGLKEECKWWPVFELGSRFIFVFAVIHLSGYLIVPLSLSIVILCVQLYTHPYNSNIANYTETCVLSLLVVIVAVGNLRVTASAASVVLWPLVYYTPLAVGLVYAAVFIVLQVWVFAISRKENFNRNAKTRKSNLSLSLKSFSVYRKTSTVTQTTVSIFDDGLDDVETET